jgi:hypothetical protein
MKEFSKEKFIEVMDAIVDSIPKTNYHNFAYKFVESSEILKQFFSGYFRMTEGSGCSADKGRFVANRIIRGLKEDKILPLQVVYDIVKYPQMKKYEGEVAYWCPEKIIDTKEALEIFTKHILNVNEYSND